MKNFNVTFLIFIFSFLFSCTQKENNTTDGRLPESKRIFEDIYGYDDYDLGLRQAKKYNRPALLLFHAIGYPLPGKMYDMMQQKEIKEKVNNDLVFISLIVDDRMKELPVSMRYYSEHFKDTVTTYSEKYYEIQIERFDMNALPFLVLLSPDNKVLSTIGFTQDIQEFKSFLKKSEQ